MSLLNGDDSSDDSSSEDDVPLVALDKPKRPPHVLKKHKTPPKMNPNNGVKQERPRHRPPPQQSRPQQSRPQQSRPQQSRSQQSRPQHSRPQHSRPQHSRSQQSRPQKSRQQQTRPVKVVKRPSSKRPSPSMSSSSSSSKNRKFSSSSSKKSSSFRTNGETKKRRRPPVFVDDDESSEDDAPLVPLSQMKKSLKFTTSPDSKKSRLIISRPQKEKKSKVDNAPMSDFIDDSYSDEEEYEDDDGGESSDMRDSDSDAPIGRKRKNMKGSGKRTKGKKSSVPGRLRRTTPAANPKKDVPIFEPDSYEINEKIQPLYADEGATKWWDREPYKGDQKWTTLRHNGVMFPPPYEAHGVQLKYKGKPVKLTKSQEEVATQFAVLIESDHAKNPVFRNNFWEDWRQDLGKDHIVQDLDNVDFRPIYDWYQKDKERKKEMKKDPEIKKKLKAAKEKEKETYGYAIVDGVREQVGNYMVELPGLFRGRGKHPKTGMVKRRLYPEDVILNIGEGEKLPPCPIEGHKWGGVMHNNTVTYIARWKDPIQNTLKPVYLHASSRFKGESDRDKYEVARKLKKKIGKIRKDYFKELNDKNRAIRQRATAIWIIDKLSIRVGNEKNKDETADTVGTCTLRKEHIEFLGEVNGVLMVKLDFLGKDSMRYLNEVKVHPEVYRNLEDFTRKKKPDEDIFDLLTPSGVNEFLSKLMPGLTAKCFRTHNASVTLQEELSKEEKEDGSPLIMDDNEEVKKYFYDLCNRKVAILCNHQKTVSKNYDEQVAKAEEKMKDKLEKMESLKEEYDVAIGKKKKRKAIKDENAKPKRARSAEQIQNAMNRMKKAIEKLRMTNNLKKENKEISLGTSKINYMDPRISVAFCKKFELPIEKVFQRALLDKFPWAMSVDPDYTF